MSKYIFQKTEEGAWDVYDADHFKWMPLTETYDDFGQKVSEEDAGACSLHNQYYTSLIGQAKQGIIEKFPELASVEFDIDGTTIDTDEDIPEEDLAKYESFLNAFEEVHFFCDKVFAHTYWNGSNWRTKILGSDHPGIEIHEKVVSEGDKDYPRLKGVYEGDWDFMPSSFGVDKFFNGGWEKTVSRWVGDITMATLTEV